jgi:succinate dehydrogenase flavin-adding protein (antitoxin of CptAB toxin-antitoxin module)
MEEFRKNTDLYKKIGKFEEAVLSEDAYDELEDDEKESFDSLLKDPRKFKLFTTAKSPEDLKKEAEQVKELVELAESIY